MERVCCHFVKRRKTRMGGREELKRSESADLLNRRGQQIPLKEKKRKD